MTVSDRMPKDYSKLFALAVLHLARGLCDAEDDKKRAKKMRLAIDEKRELLVEVFELPPTLLKDRQQLLEAIGRGNWNPISGRILLVDAAFSNPFAPYTLKYDVGDLDTCLQDVADAVRVRPAGDEIAALRKVAARAAKAHRRWWQRPSVWAAITVGGIVLTGGLGFLAAPAIAAAIGGAAGLSGAAATSYGLALLGGGSLAAGGAGMAGGLAVLTATGATLGAVGGGGASLLLSMTTDAAIAEIAKLQSTYGYALIPYDRNEARLALKDVERTRKQLEAKLSEAKLRNDEDTPDVEEMKTKLRAVANASEWMKQQLS